MLIILSGLPGAGKTTLARELAAQLTALHLRIDSIEQALRLSGALAGPMDDAGYRVGYAVAEDNLRLGRIVVADSVNPLTITRLAWRLAAERAGTRFVDVEVVCSDKDEHRRRVQERLPDLPGHRLPTWPEVENRRYEPWGGGQLIIDTTALGPADAAAMISSHLQRMGATHGSL